MASQMGIRAGRAFVELYANDDKLTRGLRTAQRKLRRFSAMVTSLGAKLSAVASLVAVPLGLTIKAASDMEETMNKFNVVFGNSSKAVKEWSDKFARDVGRSKQQVADFMAGSQDLFVPLGFEPGAATEMSKQITSLAVDLASFNNKADADVIRDLHAALTGSGEVMKKYGVLVSEAAVKQELLRTGMDPKTATDQQKVMARLSIIMQGTTAAQGDAMRSADAYANQMKRLKAVVSDTAADIGKALLPTVTAFVKYAADAVTKISGWVRENQGLVKVIAVVTAVIGAIGAILLTVGAAAGFLSFAMGGLAVAASGVATVIAVLASPITLLVAGIVAAGVAIGALIAWLMKSGDTVKQIGRVILSVFGAFATYMKSGPLSLAGELLWESLKVVWINGIADISKTYEKLKEAWKEVTDRFVSDWKSAIGEVKDETGKLKDGVNGKQKKADEGVIEVFSMTPEEQKNWWNGGKKKKKGKNDVPIMPEFAPEPKKDPALIAANDRIKALEKELAGISSGNPLADMQDTMGSAVSGTYSSLSQFIYSNGKQDGISKGDKFIGDKLDGIKQQLEDGGGLD